MIIARTVCFVCCVLLLGMAHANNLSTSPTPDTENGSGSEPTQSITKEVENIITDRVTTADISNSIQTTFKTPSGTENQGQKTNQGHFCTPSPPKPTQGQCIFYQPNWKTFVLVALTMACFTLLLTTLICACQVCHLKATISRFQSHQNVDVHAVKRLSESLCKDDGQVEGEPAETCLMLSEVTTAQEEKNEEESIQPSTEPPVEGQNGDITQEDGNSGEGESKETNSGVESKEPDTEAPENTGL